MLDISKCYLELFSVSVLTIHYIGKALCLKIIIVLLIQVYFFEH